MKLQQPCLLLPGVIDLAESETNWTCFICLSNKVNLGVLGAYEKSKDLLVYLCQNPEYILYMINKLEIKSTITKRKTCSGTVAQKKKLEIKTKGKQNTNMRRINKETREDFPCDLSFQSISSVGYITHRTCTGFST